MKYKEIIDSLQVAVFEADYNGNIVYVTPPAYDFFGYPANIRVENLNILQAIIPEERPRARENISRLFMGEDIGMTEYTALRMDGTTFPCLVHSGPLFTNGKPSGIRGIVIDISERKQASERKQTEEKQKVIRLHDCLTDLNNRTHSEQKPRSLNHKDNVLSGLLVCEVEVVSTADDISDSDTSDSETVDSLLLSVAQIIRMAVRKSDIVAGIGDNKFAIFVTCRDEQGLDSICQRIYNNIEVYNLSHPELILNISVGYSTSTTCADISTLFREAEHNMYREKLRHKQTNHSLIVKTWLKDPGKRDFITRSYAEQLKCLAQDVAVYLGLPEHKINDIGLFAQFHDIGNVGIPDNILFKPGRLTAQELKKIQEHPETGYRIAMSEPDLTPIAKLILCHHEWWNGEGYPQGLAGLDIPLECRILAICDAYGAMTNDRPYRKSLSPQQAIEEIQRNAGRQFDKSLVKVFIQVLKSKYSEGVPNNQTRSHHNVKKASS